MARTRAMWHSIIDGENRWMAELELKEENCEEFVDFMKPVSFLSNAPFQTLCLFVRHRNEPNNPEMNVSVTLSDKIRALQPNLSFLRLEISGSDVKHTQLIRHVTGKTANVPSDVRYVAQLAFNIHSKVFDALGDILNLEDVTLA